MLKLDESTPWNRRVIEHLKKGHADRAPILPPTAFAYPYMELGSHPDMVSRVWEELGDSLPADCKAVVYGRPALVNPNNGIILALAYGTTYIIRIPEDKVDAALKCGCTLEQVWAGGSKTNVGELFGKGWVFGGWCKDEVLWLSETYRNPCGAA